MFDFLTTPAFQTAIANVVIGLVGILATALTGMVAGFLHSKMSAQQLQTLHQVVSVAVMAAEQLGLSGAIEDKKQSAINAASAMLESMGIQVTAEELDAAIEAAVATQLNGPAISEASFKKADAVRTGSPAPATTDGAAA